jgi:hypothetical protein
MKDAYKTPKTVRSAIRACFQNLRLFSKENKFKMA